MWYLGKLINCHNVKYPYSKFPNRLPRSVLSDGFVNSYSLKIGTQNQFLPISCYHVSHWILVILAISSEITQNVPVFHSKSREMGENCFSWSSRFTQMVKSEITFTLNSRKFWSQPITFFPESVELDGGPFKIEYSFWSIYAVLFELKKRKFLRFK